MAALTAGQKQGAGGEYRMVSADRGREIVLAGRDYTGVFEKLLKWQADVGG